MKGGLFSQTFFFLILVLFPPPPLNFFFFIPSLIICTTIWCIFYVCPLAASRCIGALRDAPFTNKNPQTRRNRHKLTLVSTSGPKQKTWTLQRQISVVLLGSGAPFWFTKFSQKEVSLSYMCLFSPQLYCQVPGYEMQIHSLWSHGQ